jgi:hypothetical protein
VRQHAATAAIETQTNNAAAMMMISLRLDALATTVSAREAMTIIG